MRSRIVDGGVILRTKKIRVVIALALAAGVFGLYWFWTPLLSGLGDAYRLLMDRERLAEFVAAFGMGAPLIFILLQVLQVILAPIPGEATGFIGGYLFGAFYGCLYSTAALTMGSWANFGIGRFLGRHWVRRLVPHERMRRLDYLLRHQGALVVFALFVLPGFPKDYMCLFLGVSTMPVKLFLPMALLGRIPGTLMLSLNGALVFEKNYTLFAAIMVVNVVILLLGYRYREALYRWIEKINGRPDDPIDGDEIR
jgi:uncharacterized membrane protein YdjX (TVP38/TMEM64 family)